MTKSHLPDGADQEDKSIYYYKQGQPPSRKLGLKVYTVQPVKEHIKLTKRRNLGYIVLPSPSQSFAMSTNLSPAMSLSPANIRDLVTPSCA